MIYYYDKIIEKKHIINSINNGDVLVFKKLFFKLNFFKNTIRKINSLLKLDLKNEKEFIYFLDNFHNSELSDEIIKIQDLLERKLKTNFIHNTVQITKELLKSDNFWVNDSSLLRIMMPYRNMRHQRFSKRLKGRLELHDPHIDSQQSVAHNAVNLWIPISNINKKNSLLVYPDTFGKEIKTQPVNGTPYTNKITKDAFLGRPLAIECDIGDIVIFNSDLAHSSIINTSNITRWVITNRITIGEPEHSRQFFPLKYYDAKLNSKPKKFNNSYIIDRIKLKNLLIIIEFYLNQILTKYLKVNIENKIINFVKNIFNYLGLKIRKKKLSFLNQIHLTILK